MILGIDQVPNLNKYVELKEFKTFPKFKENDKKTNEFEEDIKLNKNQELAIRKAFKYSLSLIIGPPGTGKSTVLGVLAFNILLNKNSIDKILICAPSNKAVDNIISILQIMGFPNFVRVLSPTKELFKDNKYTKSLHKLVEEEIDKNPKKYGKLRELRHKKERDGFLKDSEFKIYKEIINNIERSIIDKNDIILTTINNSADERLKSVYFKYVIIDEAAQALEPDTLLPLFHNAQMAVLIGDNKQLGPVVHSDDANAAGLGISLFERLIFLYKNSDIITTLNEQYRMNEKIYKFPNSQFYENKIITRTKAHEIDNSTQIFLWPKKDFPSLFYNINGEEKKEKKSFYNDAEVSAIEKIVKKLNENKVQSDKMGIITPYNSQKQRLWSKFYKEEKYQKITIDTVDGFQGMEMDYIILSTVRCNNEGILGFLKSPKRLNVALTRPRKGLIIVGNAKCLAKRPGVFKELIKFYCSEKLIVKNSLDNLSLVREDEIFGEELDFEDDKIELEERNNEKKYYDSMSLFGKPENPAPTPLEIPNNQINISRKKSNNEIINNNINNNKKKLDMNNQEKKEKKENKIELIAEPKKQRKKKKAKKQNNKKEDEKEEDQNGEN
jgi:regulator of nonsense transcripts 1